eukprot:1180473-Prorocentrum_minimum.AAC.3
MYYSPVCPLTAAMFIWAKISTWNTPGPMCDRHSGSRSVPGGDLRPDKHSGGQGTGEVHMVNFNYIGSLQQHLNCVYMLLTKQACASFLEKSVLYLYLHNNRTCAAEIDINSRSQCLLHRWDSHPLDLQQYTRDIVASAATKRPLHHQVRNSLEVTSPDSLHQPK